MRFNIHDPHSILQTDAFNQRLPQCLPLLQGQSVQPHHHKTKSKLTSTTCRTIGFNITIWQQHQDSSLNGVRVSTYESFRLADDFKLVTTND